MMNKVESFLFFMYSRAHFPQEVKDIFDVVNALLPTANNLLPPHRGSDVAVDSWKTHALDLVSFKTFSAQTVRFYTIAISVLLTSSTMYLWSDV